MVSETINLLFEMRASRGDANAAKFLQSRDPEQQGVSLELGELKTTQDLVRAQRVIAQASAAGKLSAQDAKKMGEQLENIGKAIERDDLFGAIEQLREKIGSTKQSKFNADLRKEIEVLAAEIQHFLVEEDRTWEEVINQQGENIEDYMITRNYLGYLIALCHMTSEDFIKSGFYKLLPRSVQELFDIFKNVRHPRRGDKKEKYKFSYSSQRSPKRWEPEGWMCKCKNTNTLWIETKIRLADHIRIYCDSCFKHVGWGTPDDFEKAHEEGHANWVEHSETQVIEKMKPVPRLEEEPRIKKDEKNTPFVDDD